MAKILIADDEAHILRVISMWLTRTGSEVLEARDGIEALAVIDRETVDLIVSDMNMPGLNGLEFARILREERRLRIPFLLLTARCDQDSLARLIEPYDLHLYPKPFVPSRLVADIERLLRSTMAPDPSAKA